MAFNDFPSFNIDDIVGFNNNGPRDYDFGFGGYNLDLPNIAGPSQPDATTDVWGGLGDFGGPCWDLSNLEGPSQPYTGVEVWGDLNKYPDFPAPLSPNSAPTSLNPANEEAPGEGKSCQVLQSHRSKAYTSFTGYFSSFYQRTATSPFLEPAATPPQYSTHSPVLTLSWGGEPLPFPDQAQLTHLWRLDQPLPEESYATPTALAYHLYEQPQVVPNPDGLSSNLFTAAGSSSLSTVHTPPYYNPPCEERELVPRVYHPTCVFTSCDKVLHQLLQAGPYYPDMPSVDMVTVSGSTPQLVPFAYPVSQRVAPPEYPLPPPVASSSGPKRTGQHARGARRHNPIRATKKVDPANPPKKANPIKSTKKIDPRNDEEGWLRTLARFRGEFDALYSVQDGHPPGGLVPETAFAETNKFIKEDLKQSVSCSFYCVLAHHFTNSPTWQQPFQDTAAGKGERVRDLEDYLKRLVNVILPKPAPGEGRSKRDDEVVGILSRRKRFFPSLQSGLAN